MIYSSTDLFVHLWS